MFELIYNYGQLLNIVIHSSFLQYVKHGVFRLRHIIQSHKLVHYMFLDKNL